MDRTSRNLLTVIILLAIAAIIGCVITAPARASDLPLWKQPAVFNAAGKYCLYDNGVFNIRPNRDGNYWLTCNNGNMVRIKIKVSNQQYAVAAL